jgi:L-threonylcarbamoyladenylate synthase
MIEEINKTINILKEGGTILYPTDTVWGLGCDATNPTAVAKIFSIKKREESKSLIILIDDEIKLNKYLKEVPEVAWELIENTDKPLTIIYDGACNLAKNVIAADGSIAIRIVKDEFCRKLINRLGKPLVSTSANISGEQAPSNFHEIAPELKKQVDHVVNWRQEEINSAIPSSIIKLSVNGDVKIIRN